MKSKASNLPRVKYFVLFSIIVAILFLTPLVFSGGGDLGGGGVLNKKFQLENTKLELLRSKGKVNQAKDIWLNTMTPEEEAAILDIVFRHFIVPQLRSDKIREKSSSIGINQSLRK